MSADVDGANYIVESIITIHYKFEMSMHDSCATAPERRGKHLER